MYGLPRRSRRIQWDAEVTLSRADDLSYHVRLRDISQHGCSLALVNRIPVGGRLWLRIPNLSPIAGVIRWEKDFLAGVDFETPLHPKVLDMLVRSQRG